MNIKAAYRLRVCERLYSFNDRIEEVPVCDVPLWQWQEEAFESHGVSVSDIDDISQVAERSLVFDNNLFFTKQFVAWAIARAARSAEPLRFCLDQNTFNQQFVLPIDDSPSGLRAFGFFYHAGDEGGYRDTVVPQTVYEYGATLPRELLADPEFHFDLCDTFATAIISPFHLLQANLAMLGHRSAVLLGAAPRWLVTRLASLAPQGSRLFHFLLRRQNRIGKRCRIHRTAVIEGCVIGDDVTLGAYSVARLSRIGSGSTLEDHASVHYSALGRNNWIAAHNHICQCMTYDDVFLIHGPYAFSVFGRNSCVFATLNCDVRLDKKTITIPTDRGPIDSGRPLLGIAYGHDTKVGAGTIIAPGRIVPNGKCIDPPAAIILDPSR